MQYPIVEKFALYDTTPGSISYYWLKLISDPLGNPICIPVMVARGAQDGPVLGVTAAVHGNELNGIPVIQRLFAEIDAQELKGTIVGVPVVNIPSFIRKKRRFNDGVDLNHIMPGKADGSISQVYAYRLIDRLVRHFDYLLDLHTASQGRTNSYYVRADMKNPVTRKMAMLQNAQLIVNNPPSDGTLRGAAEALDIPAITSEVGNPATYQRNMIRSGLEGVHNTLSYLEMIDDPIIEAKAPPIRCKSSFWIYTDTGGLLSLHVQLLDRVKEGDHIATIRDVFGAVRAEYHAPQDGVVIGRSVSPVNQTGGRILHLGVERPTV